MSRTRFALPLLLILNIETLAYLDPNPEYLCYNRYKPDIHDFLHPTTLSEIQSKLDGFDIGPEKYDLTTGRFLTEFRYDGPNISRTEFCEKLKSGSHRYCLDIESLITDDIVHTGVRIDFPSDYCRKLESDTPEKRKTLNDARLANVLRSYDRAILYDTEVSDPDSNTGEITMQATLPIITTDMVKAEQYFNESVKYYFYARSDLLSCKDEHSVALAQLSSGGFRATYKFSYDNDCLASDGKGYSYCERYQKKFVRTFEFTNRLVYENGVCFQAADCQASYCRANQISTDVRNWKCEPCPSGQYLFKSGTPSVLKTACDAMPAEDNACKKIIESKINECSLNFTGSWKRTMSFVQHVDCLENDDVKLTWTESLQATTARQGEIKSFLAEILNLTSGHIALDLKRRELVVDTGSRRRLLAEDAAVLDDSTTDVTVHVRNESVPDEEPTVSSGSGAGTAVSGEEGGGFPMAAAAVPAVLVLLCGLYLCLQGSGSGSGAAARAARYVPVQYGLRV
tara:strand:- start:3832 stop:5367 length:1536 start_codon:yes stop_codon:yes gene_type:complete